MSKTSREMGSVTVDMHIRNSRTIFNHAVNDDIILFNPFDRLSKTVKAERAWHYVSGNEYEKLVDFAPNVNWQLLISLCRLAGLRRGEALNLEWSDVNWESNHIRIIAKEEWQPKDKKSRRVPICPELQKLLLEAYDRAKPRQKRIIEGIAVVNLWRDFNVVRRRAGVDKYSKPFHTLRKSCITDWAASYPAHVVKAWAGHSSLETTDRYYLQVPEAEYERAATNKFWHKTAQDRFNHFSKMHKSDTTSKSESILGSKMNR